MKPDDATLKPQEYAQIRREAEKVLRQAGALGRIPTPIADVMDVAKLKEASESLSELGLLDRLRAHTGETVKRALRKVVGLLHASSRFIFIDKGLPRIKQTFVRLHEIAHGFLPWQREIYAVVEDCESTLAPEVAELFEREANVFAAEVLFQLNSFSEEAAAYDFSVKVPLRLARKYEASIYSSIREYVRKNHRPCAVLVLDPPEASRLDGFVASLRRVELSPSFKAQCGPVNWPQSYTPDDPVGAMVPLGKQRMSRPHELNLVDSDGNAYECIGEAFTQGYQVFVLILLVQRRSKSMVTL